MRLDDGHATLISFANFPTVKFWEKEVTPPSMMGGGANDTTTMRNVAVRTKKPKKLKTVGDMKFTAAYDPEVFDVDEVWAMLQDNQLITVVFPNGAEIAFWGWLDEFQPNSNKEGEQPTAACTIIASNLDDSDNEVVPVYTAP